jgi:hypothetical protein
MKDLSLHGVISTFHNYSKVSLVTTTTLLVQQSV